jgi:phenylpyruvate tautomerase PptA (4-oxalocrotonate tautomerase family)
MVPTVTITQSRRSPELKRRLIAAITEVIVAEYAVRSEQVAVHFIELDEESWGRGGLLACDFPDSGDDPPTRGGQPTG